VIVMPSPNANSIARHADHDRVSLGGSYRRNPALAIVPSVRYWRVTSDACTPDGRQLWDLESWDVAQEFAAERPAGVPLDASKDYGYRAADGQLHTVFRRVARKAVSNV
jgi:hypothetical protein